jgi:hypothetical protein
MKKRKRPSLVEIDFSTIIPTQFDKRDSKSEKLSAAKACAWYEYLRSAPSIHELTNLCRNDPSAYQKAVLRHRRTESPPQHKHKQTLSLQNKEEYLDITPFTFAFRLFSKECPKFPKTPWQRLSKRTRCRLILLVGGTQKPVDFQTDPSTEQVAQIRDEFRSYQGAGIFGLLVIRPGQKPEAIEKAIHEHIQKAKIPRAREPHPTWAQQLRRLAGYRVVEYCGSVSGAQQYMKDLGKEHLLFAQTGTKPWTLIYNAVSKHLDAIDNWASEACARIKENR